MCITAGLAVDLAATKFSDKIPEGAPCGWYCLRSGWGRGARAVDADFAVASMAIACCAGVGTPIAELGVVEPEALKTVFGAAITARLDLAGQACKWAALFTVTGKIIANLYYFIAR